jgi:hypothetical protein
MDRERNIEMGLAGNEPPQNKETRWGQVLEEVVEEQGEKKPWWLNLGVFLAWAAGIAVAMALVVTLALGIFELVSPGQQFTARKLSDWIFWSAAILMVVGLLAPSASDTSRSSNKDKKQGPVPKESKSTQAMRKRIQKVYDPWRWRIWGAAILTFGIAVLVGIPAMS